MERLQKVIANSGLCSRRKAEELILEGKVTVNGQIIDTLGFKVDPDDEISVEGKQLETEQKVVYVLNKPKNVISSASDDRGRTTVVDLVDCEYRIYPMGRLDFDSSGLILLSNDGELMQKLIHPKFHIEKVYEVTIKGLISEEEITQMEKGVMIDDYLTSPCKITMISQNETKKTSRMSITIYEGRNRQIRKMYASLGYEVIRLHRIKEANITLDGLASGEYRKLKPYEVRKLKQYLDRNDFE